MKAEINIFLDGYYKAWSMGSGPCRLCTECDLTTPCKHGYEARPSMGACGIDVFKAARDNGFPVEVVRTREEERNAFGLILVESSCCPFRRKRMKGSRAFRGGSVGERIG